MPKFKLFLLFFLLGSFLFAQQHEILKNEQNESYYKKQSISKNDLDKYINNEAFNYEVDNNEDSLFAKIKRWFYNLLNRLFFMLTGVNIASGVLGYIISIIPYVLLSILLFLLIRFFLKVNSINLISGEQNKPIINFTDEEQIIKNEDINALIAEAVKQNNFRLAIRYYYLLSLKKLSDNNIIDWQQQKTNEDYKKEIKQNTIQSQFEKITKIYDYVWYGKFKVDAPKFENLKGDFINLNKQISH